MTDIPITKTDAMQELAVALVLVLEFFKGADSDDKDAQVLIDHTRERAREALEISARFTRISGMDDVREFLEAKIDNFTIVCGPNIVKADTIRFTEAVYDNRRRPPLYIGRRLVSADVLDIKENGDNTILTLQIVTTKGCWPLKAGTETKRFLKNIIHFGIRREPWDHEERRKEVKKAVAAKGMSIQEQAKVAARQVFGRYDVLRSQEEPEEPSQEEFGGPVRPNY